MWQPREMRTEHATCSKCHKNIDTSFTRPARWRERAKEISRVKNGVGVEEGRGRGTGGAARGGCVEKKAKNTLDSSEIGRVVVGG